MIPLPRLRPNNGIRPNKTIFASVSAPTCYHCARIAIELQSRPHSCRSYASQQARHQESPGAKYQRWTKEEDDIVISLRRERKTWPEIQTALPHRTYQAVSARWNQHLEPILISRQSQGTDSKIEHKEDFYPEPLDARLLARRFSDDFKREEDEKIALMRRDGASWKDVQEVFPWRSIDSLKSRWGFVKLKQNLPSERARGKHSDKIDDDEVRGRALQSWTSAELKKLHHLKDDLGSKWTDIAAKFPERSYTSVKSQYLSRRQRGDATMRRHYTQQEDEKILRLRARGLTWAAIADEIPIRTAKTLERRFRLLQKRM